MTPAVQPRHRRPSWKQSLISHRTYLEADVSRKQNPELPMDGDTFCYNPAFVTEWTMPADLWIRLPSSLTAELRDWQAAGAAVCTALIRIEKLNSESLYRGWPARSNAHLSRSISDSSALETSCSPDSPSMTAISESAGLSPLQTSFSTGGARDPFSVADTTTPPFTPQDSIMGDEFDLSGKPVYDKVGLKGFENLSADRVRRDSENATSTSIPSPSMAPNSRRASANSNDPTQSQFDESSWDVFIRSYEAELEQLRAETFVRFRHLSRSVDRLWLDLKNDIAHPMLQAASIEFVNWWSKAGDKAQEYEKEIQMLGLPELDFVKMKRSAQGLPT